MPSTAFKWFMVAGVVFGSNASAWTQELDAGKTEYLSSCGACHGADGKGKGPLSMELKSATTDLTVLAKKNGGVFPVNAVYEVIDGRKSVNAHGTREMPIWGFVYQPSFYQKLNPSLDAEVTVLARELAIIEYLNRMQEK